MRNAIKMYSTTWCPDCHNAKRFLQSYDIPYEEIDISADEAAAQLVMGWSGGKRVVPTFSISGEGEAAPTIMHNPPHRELARVLGLPV
ncbi:MAG: glutaredoxin domain-containing protein [Bacteroidota bacterium]